MDISYTGLLIYKLTEAVYPERPHPRTAVTLVEMEALDVDVATLIGTGHFAFTTKLTLEEARLLKSQTDKLYVWFGVTYFDKGMMHTPYFNLSLDIRSLVVDQETSTVELYGVTPPHAHALYIFYRDNYHRESQLETAKRIVGELN